MIYIFKYRKAKGRQALQYPDIPSLTAPVSHDDSLPVPQPPQNVSILLLIILSKSSTFNLIKHEVFTLHLFFNEVLNAQLFMSMLKLLDVIFSFFYKGRCNEYFISRVNK